MHSPDNYILSANNHLGGMRANGGRVNRNRGGAANGHKVSFWGDGNVLNLDDGDGCTINK